MFYIAGYVASKHCIFLCIKVSKLSDLYGVNLPNSYLELYQDSVKVTLIVIYFYVTGTLRDTLVSLSVMIASVVSLNEFLLVDILHKDPSSIADTVVCSFSYFVTKGQLRQFPTMLLGTYLAEF